ERARGDEAGMAERDLPGAAREQHERDGADRAEENLVADLEPERVGCEWIKREQNHEEPDPALLRARIEQRAVLAVARAVVAAHTRSSSSRVPNNPHGRTTSIPRRTANGTTSESSGST